MMVHPQDQSEWQIEWQMTLGGLVQRSWLPACARVLAGQLAYLQLRNRRAIHGKEKVYGSIP